MNVKCNPLRKVKKVEYTVKIENKKQLEERIAELDKKIAIKDDIKNKQVFFNTMINRKRLATKARYGKKPKDQALEQINNKKQELINKLTVYFE